MLRDRRSCFHHGTLPEGAAQTRLLQPASKYGLLIVQWRAAVQGPIIPGLPPRTL